MNPSVPVSVMAALFLFGCGVVEDTAEPGAPSTLSQAISVNGNVGFLVVYNVNYENLPTASEMCAGTGRISSTT